MGEIDLSAAVEAAARAEYESDWEDEPTEKRIEWADALPFVREEYLRRVRAAAPIIERAVRERIAKLLESADLAEGLGLRTAAHYLTENLDAQGSRICSCGEWADDLDPLGWNEHLAFVALEFAHEALDFIAEKVEVADGA